MPVLSNTPQDVPINPRNREYDIAECLGRDWFDNHAFKTAWFNAMSITFPLGEKFFIDSVRYFQDQIDDPKLQAEIRRLREALSQHGAGGGQLLGGLTAPGETTCSDVVTRHQLLAMSPYCM